MALATFPACLRARAALGVALLAATLVTPVRGDELAALRPPTTPAHLEAAGTIALPGRGLSLAWSPDGTRIAVGGHFRERATRLRYDTRIADVARRTIVKSFACHWFWAVSQAWFDHPDYGELLADGGGDHAVKIWNPNARGSTRCNPGQFLPADGALEQLGGIDGWIVSLAFSPDGRWLAGASRDRTVRIWQIHPGPSAWRVVGLWLDSSAGNFLSVDWAPDGRALVTGDRRGRVAVWDFDPVRDRWDDAIAADFARQGYEQQPAWFRAHASLTTRLPRWSETGHLAVWNARWSPDGTRVAAAASDGTVSVYDGRMGAVSFRQLLPRRGSFNGLAWHPAGRWLVAGGSDGLIYVYDTGAGVLRDTLAGHDDVVTSLAWSPDGQVLASTAGGPLLMLRLVEVSEGPDQAIHLWRWR
jgi:WD40 repeat protein